MFEFGFSTYDCRCYIVLVKSMCTEFEQTALSPTFFFYFRSQIYNLLYSGVISKCVWIGAHSARVRVNEELLERTSSGSGLED
jgi:hypothetical protein